MDRVEPCHASQVQHLHPVAFLPCPLDERGRINPHATRFALADGRQADVFHVEPVYYRHVEGWWRPLSEVCSRTGNHDIAIRPDRVSWVHPTFLIWLMHRQRLLGAELAFWAPGYAGVQPRHLEFAASLTANPDPSPETTTFDGYVMKSDAVWATAHAAASGTNGSSSLGYLFTGVARGQSPGFEIYRSIALFNTSALGAGATGISADLSVDLFDNTVTDNDGDDWFNVVNSTPASNTVIVTGDFDNIGDAVTNPTEGSTRKDISSTSTGVVTFSLNATGLTWINQTGVTKLGFREGHDALDHATDAGSFTYAGLRSADYFVSASRPKLTVTYTPPPPGAGLGDPLRAFQHMIMR